MQNVTHVYHTHRSLGPILFTTPSAPTHPPRSVVPVDRLLASRVRSAIPFRLARISSVFQFYHLCFSDVFGPVYNVMSY